MAQSVEYPDLKWVPPASYSPGRPSGKPRFIVIHTTEGSSHDQSAEDGAAYDARRDDGTSTHYFVDRNTVIHCVRTTDRAHTAGPTGNLFGIQYELCAKASYGTAWWTGGSYALGMLRLAAKQAARDAKKYGIPVKKITPADLRAGGRGFVGHADVTYAWGEVDHTDPGPSFPWSMFLQMVNQEMNPAPEPEEEDDDMPHQFAPVFLPNEFAYDENNNAIDSGKASVSIPLEPIGFSSNPNWSGRRLVAGLGTDGTPDGKSVRIRVAINTGKTATTSGWNVKYYDVAKGERVSVEVPGATGPQAYNIIVGRVKRSATPEDWETDVPVSFSLAIL